MPKKVEWDYVVPIVMPADLEGVEPGKLPESLLRPIKSGGKLHWRAADAWNAMVAKATSDGVLLKPTSAGDLYRSYDSQKKSFLLRYRLDPIPGASTKTFEGKTWYLRKGMAMLATPGKSNHNLGFNTPYTFVHDAQRRHYVVVVFLIFFTKLRNQCDDNATDCCNYSRKY